MGMVRQGLSVVAKVRWEEVMNMWNTEDIYGCKIILCVSTMVDKNHYIIFKYKTHRI
jgi:hypothetical protein